MRRQSILIIAVLVLLAAAGAYAGFGRGPLVTAVPVTRGTAAEIVYATGGVEPVTWAKVASLVRGRIVYICHCESETLKKGWRNSTTARRGPRSMSSRPARRSSKTR